MPTRSITVTVASIGASAGPFNISDNVLGVIAMNVSRAQLLAGYAVNSDVNSTTITVNSIGACSNSITIILPTPTPTPTPTPGPSPTPTPTPTVTPVSQTVFFDTNYTSTSDVCGQGGRAWSRLTGPSGSVVQLTLSVTHPIPTISGSIACIKGSLYETTLPSTNPAVGSVLTEASASVGAAFVPFILSDTETVNITLPASGYKDMMLIYRTSNLVGNFTSGNAVLFISGLNGSPVTGGGSIAATYGCTDSGTCI